MKARNDEGNWRDTGCEVSKSCLACPLPVCRHDLPLRGLKSVLVQARVREAQRAGLDAASIAETVGISKRSVYRRMLRATPNG